MKYSIIVPAYNVERYIDRCLKSILSQTYDKFEVIVVNDGSTDDTKEIINKFVKKDQRLKLFTKENGGLSDARNYGIDQSSGDVIVFIDGDDYIDKDLLLNLNNEFSVNRAIDAVRFQLRLVDDDKKTLEIPGYEVFSNLSINRAYPILLTNKYVDVAWAYAYRREFFIRNNFKYAKGKIHEDLGLTHLVLVKSKKISSIDYIGYNYVQREGSIINTNTRKQNLRKAYDTLFHFDNYIKILTKDSSINENNKDLLINYLLITIIHKSKLLKDSDFCEYVKELKQRKIYKYFPNKTSKDKLRRLVVRFCLKKYINKNI